MLNERWQKSIFIVFLLTIITTSQISFAQSEQNKNYFNLKITHALFSLVLSSYFSEGERIYDARRLAKIAYIKLYLKEWETLIEHGGFSTTKAIFNSLNERNSFIGRYSKIWQELLPQKGRRVSLNLGYLKNMVLGSFLQSEKMMVLEERVERIIKDSYQYILVGSDDKQLNDSIVSAFSESHNENVQNVLSELEMNKHLNSVAVGLIFLRNISIGYAGAKTILNYHPRLIPKFGDGVLKFGKNLWTKMSVLQKTIATSAGLHLTFFDQMSSEIMPGDLADGNQTMDKKLLDPVLYLLKLRLNGLVVYQNLATTNMHDFTQRYQLGSKADLKKKVLSSFKLKTSQIDFLDIILKMEKFMKIDRRDKADLLAFEMQKNRVELMIQRLDKDIVSNKLSAQEFITIRKKIIKNDINKYARDYPNLFALLTNWGGNCVSQTLLVTGLLARYQGHFFDDMSFKYRPSFKIRNKSSIL